MSTLCYEMVIVWSEEDDCFLVHLPDFPKQTYRTHGNSYEEAARSGQEVLQLLLEEDGLPLPEPKPYAA
ncbi:MULTISPECIES: type II toxin-antitoxin system HicB family antitoxin [Cyanophyceae]|uniref:type II toxin-antitoxin system HicB family antitoxin n=1 Tax=Cyanophyceae TaxID=3028117 RepID=UPI00168380BD|nr:MULTISPECIES: type II toxin-antitoxin system HicB family antitoxin [Cyanophyceae]MBD1916732.1 type II toxin-antitoxin system HicB family antitoxin [Phormidium sp. FACHB-77]MBD2029362.1 type II toxin-antitoxin system HicB family antitoxin [Phormidium sp. FACHB-322]MBD2051937.1 type II toxin-antitoxin system HicB family antitoxin [Leptolyngbya sp. FACHB-60]